MRYFAAVLVLAIAAGCASTGDDDAIARAVCGDFRDVARDHAVMTDADMVEAAQEIDRRAQMIDDPQLADAARGYAAATVNGTLTPSDVNALGEACEAHR